MKLSKSLIVPALFATVSVPAFGQLEEIVVTAQKREESLQNVPTSVLPVMGQFLVDQNIRQLDELSEITPSLFVAEGFTSSNIVIRGIGTESGGNSAFEQAVVTFIDGVAYGRERSAVGQFLDLNRIEILRGPQPVFFGQSATAGALNIITERPGEEQDGYAQAQFGSDNTLQIEGARGGPLSDTFGIRAAGIYQETDGWLDAYDPTGVPGAINPDNVPDTAPQKESYAGRLSAVWNISENFEMYLKGQWSKLEQNGFPQEAGSCNFDLVSSPFGTPAQSGCAQAQLSGIMDDNIVNGVTQNGSFVAPPPAASFIGGAVAFPTFDPRGMNDHFTRGEYRDLNSADYNMTLNWDTDSMLITSVTGYYDYDTDWSQDVSQSPYALFNTRNLQDYDQWSQEIRLTSPGGQTIDWMVGAYYQDGDLRAAQNLYTAFIVLPVGGEEHRENAEWRSLFASVTWNLTDQARLNIGGRWTDIAKTGSIRSVGGPGQGNPGVIFTCDGAPCGFGPFAIGPGQVVTGIDGLVGGIYLPPLSPFDSPALPGTGFDTKFEDDNFSPQVSLEWDFNEHMMGYAKYVEAFKSGGFNASIFAPDTIEEYTYESEIAEGWEAGIRSTLADGRLRLNVTVFDTEYSNLQVPGFDSVSGTFPIKNAARSSTSGIEIDGQWAPSDDLLFNYSLAFTDAKFDDFPDAECGSFETAETLRTGARPRDLSTGSCLIDRTGRKLNLVPDWEFNVAGSYTWHVSDWDVSLSGTFYYSDGYQVDLDSLFPDGIGNFPSYEIVNVRLSAGPANGRYEVAVVGNNLTDTERSTGIGPGSLQGAETSTIVYDQGRRWGVQARYNFGN